MLHYTGKLLAEVQSVPAATQFTGVAPDTEDYFNVYGVRRFKQGTVGGLFDLLPHTDASFATNDRIRKVMSVKMKLGGPTQTWTISIASDGHPDIVWLSGTTDTDFIHDEAEGLLHLAPNERLKIETALSNVELTAHVMYDLVGDPLR
jgi:hypothetical protein